MAYVMFNNHILGGARFNIMFPAYFQKTHIVSRDVVMNVDVSFMIAPVIYLNCAAICPPFPALDKHVFDHVKGNRLIASADLNTNGSPIGF